MRLKLRDSGMRRHVMAADTSGVYESSPDPAVLLAKARAYAAQSEQIKIDLVMTWLDMHALGGIPAITGWSPLEWLQLEAGLSRFEAHRLVRMASRLQTLQHTLGVLAAGHINFEQAAVICAETTRLRGDVLLQVERFCCDHAIELRARGDNPDILGFVQEAVQDARGPRDVERVEARARAGQTLVSQQDFDGGGFIYANLDPVSYDTTVRGIEDAAGRPTPAVSRTMQRAEGLVAMASGWLAGGTDTPATPTKQALADADGVMLRQDGEHPDLLSVDEHTRLDAMVRRGAATAKPSVTVLVDLEKVQGPYLGVLLQSVGRRAPRLSARLLDTLTCAGDLIVQLTEGRRPLVELKDRHTLPAVTRRAVIARDRGCRWTGCARPAWMCDVHHIIAREDGGDHHPDNLVVLCREHHVRLHGTHWTATLDGATAAFCISRRADGTEPAHTTFPRGIPPPVAAHR
jgi:hypothetical protein